MGQTCKVLHGVKCTQLVRRNNVVRKLETRLERIANVLELALSSRGVCTDDDVSQAIAIAKGKA